MKSSGQGGTAKTNLNQLGATNCRYKRQKMPTTEKFSNRVNKTTHIQTSLAVTARQEIPEKT